jgi:hypothetical protein
MTRTLLLRLALVACSATGQAGAQTAIASRVGQAPDGIVRMQYDAHPDACGDGRDIVGFRRALFGSSFESYGGWSNARCVAGPLRVSLTVADRRPVSVRTQIGGAWPATSERVTDLGIVSSREASAYFLSIVPALESGVRKGRMLLPAVLAADAVVMPQLIAIARDGSRADDTRRQAIQWIGQLGDASVVPVLVGFARDGSAGGAPDDN